MSRSGYTEELSYEDPLAYGRWRAQVKSAIRGKRGQAFLKELAAEMDAMPEKALIASELVNENGHCCTIGVVCKARGLDVSKTDPEVPEQVAGLVGIARPMAAEIEYENDECGWHYGRGGETPAERWQRMRKWVESKLRKEQST
jgi:hypothetical protein